MTSTREHRIPVHARPENFQSGPGNKRVINRQKDRRHRCRDQIKDRQTDCIDRPAGRSKEPMKGRMVPRCSTGPDHADDGSVGGHQLSGNENQKILKGGLGHFTSEDLQYGEKTRGKIGRAHV